MHARLRPTSTLLDLDITLVLIASYALFFLAAKVWGVPSLYSVPGLLLFALLPGLNVIRSWPSVWQGWSRLGRFVWAVFISVSIFGSFGLLTGPPIPLTREFQAVLLVLVNLACWLTPIYLRRPPMSFRSAMRAATRPKPWEVIAILVPLVILGIIYAINPLAQNADGYLVVLKNTVEQNVSLLAMGPRKLFVITLAQLHFMLGLSYIWLYRIFYVLLFSVSSLLVYVVARGTLVAPRLQVLAYWLIMGSPAVFTEINIIRPQVGVICYTLPVLILATQAMRERSLPLAGFAIWFSLIALGYHELGGLLVLMSGLPLLAIVWHETIVSRRITWKHYLAGAIAIFPYFFLPPIQALAARFFTLFGPSLGSLFPLHWRWWFIGSYVGVDGNNISWPGVLAVQYYLYNGILLLVAGLVCWVLARNRRQLRAYALLPALYSLIYLAFAELLPRLGIYFLPNRAWVHLMLPLPLIIIFSLASLERQAARRLLGLVEAGLLAVVIAGTVGTLYVARGNVSSVYPQELGAVNFIKNHTPANSLVISSQLNDTLVYLYGERGYGQIKFSGPVNRGVFDTTVNAALVAFSSNTTAAPLIERREIKTYRGDQLVSEETETVLPPQPQAIPILYHQGDPVYFLYSFTKTQGINAQRGYLQLSDDIPNAATYPTLGYTVIYRDASGLVLRLR